MAKLTKASYCAIQALISTPGAVGSLGGKVSIFYNKTGCDNVGQVALACSGTSPLMASGNGQQDLNFGQAESAIVATIAPNPASDFVTVRWEGKFEMGSL